jgi:hypothetical protein
VFSLLRKNERLRPDLTVHFHRILLSTLRRIMQDFTESAKNFAKDFGIWYLNGIALSQLATKLNLLPSNTSLSTTR